MVVQSTTYLRGRIQDGRIHPLVRQPSDLLSVEGGDKVHPVCVRSGCAMLAYLIGVQAILTTDLDFSNLACGVKES